MTAPAVLAAPAFAQVAAPQEKSDAEIDNLGDWIARYGRPTASVMLNGEGPFRFLVDTGANLTVVSQQTVERLALATSGEAVVNGTTGAASMPLVNLGSLVAGAVRRADVRAAVVGPAGLVGWDGMLGAELFAGRRLVFDIRARQVRLENSNVRGQIFAARNRNLSLRNGMLPELTGKVGRVGARLILDTGADSSICNLKLSEALRQAHPGLKRLGLVNVTGVTGQSLAGEGIALPRITIDNLDAIDAHAVVADAPVFHAWDLADEPALIVGVDMLSRLKGFSIDYGSLQFKAIAQMDWRVSGVGVRNG